MAPPTDDQAEATPEFAWHRHEEGTVYLAAVVSYTAIGVALQSILLNWVAGPLYFVSFVWISSSLLARRAGRRP